MYSVSETFFILFSFSFFFLLSSFFQNTRLQTKFVNQIIPVVELVRVASDRLCDDNIGHADVTVQW